MVMKSRKSLLSAAALSTCALLASGTARAGAALTAWSDLWHTPDQQGQALLDAGKPGEAARRFHDPRRRAYADLQAGRDADAAKLLAPFGDAESEYNRGNALAKTGQLQAALAAYDAALKQAPADKDARHNRDLIERALRQQPRSPQPSSGNGGAGKRGAASSGQQGRQSQSAAGGRSGSGSRPSGASQPSGNVGPQSAGSREGDSSSSQPGNARPGNGSSKESAGQAQRDAALAAAYARERQRSGSGRRADTPADSGLLAGGTQTPRQKPETERQLALDQWLRQIPDSPAGLLQRKFLIEHMMKQENGNPEGSD